MKLDIFKDTGVAQDKLHPKFKLLRDSLFEERAIVQAWTENFVDRDNKIVTEFQTSFHSSFWEFFLHAIFIEAGHQIDFNFDRPDFIISRPSQILVEAVVAEIKKHGIPESKRGPDDLFSMCKPPHLQPDFKEFLDEAIVRNSNALLSKSSKYLNNYIKLSWVDPATPFVIAMCSFDQVSYGREYNYGMLALLYGRYYNAEERNYELRSTINKPGTNSDIPIGIFHDPAFGHISAIIFSCTLTLGKLTSLANSLKNVDQQFNKVVNVRHDTEAPFYKMHIVSEEVPEELSDGIFVFHNPNAINKVPEGFLAQTNAIHFHVTKEGFYAIGENAPIVTRLNLPKMMFHQKIIDEMDLNFNS